ncbi:hypothetical protein [Streptomyces sp. NPDC001068]|uniref:hypothetical protein n=1 Tax=Streptomyces sp. NPDC001068 TaxID=3364544 RepID=UPI0036B9C6B9
MSGSGSPANPYVVSAEVPCSDVRACLSGGPGINYNAATGQISAKLSASAGNNLVANADGLFVPTGAATVTAGAGLTGNGAAANPLKANVGTWPYTCPVNTAGGVVVVDSTGKLRGEPRGSASFTSFFDDRTYNDVAVPDPTTVVDTFSATLTNPSSCLPCLAVVEQEVDIYLVLPAGAGAATGFDGDEMYYTRNTGTSSIVGAHSQGTKVLSRGVIAAGATLAVSFGAQVGRGSAGAYYYRIQYTLRALLLAL